MCVYYRVTQKGCDFNDDCKALIRSYFNFNTKTRCSRSLAGAYKDAILLINVSEGIMKRKDHLHF